MKTRSILMAAWVALFSGAGWLSAQQSHEESSSLSVGEDTTAWVELGGALVPEFGARLSWFDGVNYYAEDLEVQLEPGLAVFGGFREYILPWLAAELQSGLLYHDLDEATTSGGAPWSFEASLFEVPMSLNLVVELPGKHRFTPFAGAGAGAVVSWLDVDTQLPGDGGAWIPVDESSIEATFAYQAFAGVRLRAGDSGSLSLTYRFLGSGSPGWGLDQSATGVHIGTLKSDDIHSHVLTLGFHVGF